MATRRASHQQRKTGRTKDMKAAEAEKPKLPLVYTLNNGVDMPSVGLGTCRIKCGDTVVKMVDNALKAGYRSFDTSAQYGNEGQLKYAFKELLPKHKLDRSDIFITSKLGPSDYGGAQNTEKAFLKSLNNLGPDYVDLFLIQYPRTSKAPTNVNNNNRSLEIIWSKLIEMYDDGKINAIGVSNFSVPHLTDLMVCNRGVVPVLNQVEWHPSNDQTSLYKFCKKNDILLQAVLPLGDSSSHILLKDPTVVKIAKKLEVSPFQLLLAWSLQQDVAVLSKLTSRETLIENISLEFKIPDKDMKALNMLEENNAKCSRKSH